MKFFSKIYVAKIVRIGIAQRVLGRWYCTICKWLLYKARSISEILDIFFEIANAVIHFSRGDGGESVA